MVFLRLCDNFGTNWIELDIADSIREVVGVQRRGKVATLPEMAFLIAHSVNSLGVLSVHGHQDTVQSLWS